MHKLTLLTTLLVLLLVAPASAGHYELTAPFQLGEWIQLDASQGPVTLHRIRIVPQRGRSTKPTYFRPGNDDHVATVVIELEYTNSSAYDWEVDFDLTWSDEDGVVIDGYNDRGELDEGERNEKAKATLATLKYGLDRARELHITLDYDRE